MNITLYECSNDVIRALEELPQDEKWGVDTLEAVIGQFEAKAENVAAYTLNMDAPINAIKSHIKDMQSKLKALENRQQSLKDYLSQNMKRCNITEITAQNHTFCAKFRKNPPSVVIDDERMIDEQYMRIIPETRTPDKTAIKQAIQAGKTVQGARIVQNERLEIR